MDIWLNTAAEPTPIPWILVSLAGDENSKGSKATWIEFGGGGGGGGETALEAGDTNIAFPLNGVIQIPNGNNITTTAVVANTLQINLTGTTEHAVQVGSAAGALHSIGVGAAGEVLIGATGADPAFGVITNAILPGAGEITLNDGQNITVTGSPVVLGGAVTIDLSGIIPIVNGGTNNSSSGVGGNTAYTQFGVFYYDGTRYKTLTSLGAADQVLTSNGAGVVPSWKDVGAAGQTSLLGNSGPRVDPTADVIGVLGANNQLSTTGAGSTLTISIRPNPTIPGLGTGLVYANAGSINTINNGTINYLLQSTGPGTPPVWAPGGGGGGGLLVTPFTVADSGSMWAKNPNTKMVTLMGWNGGGGGGAGSALGGGPGGGGGFGGAFFITLPAFFFGVSELITVGSGGAGGTSPTGLGGDGGYTKVGNLGVPNGTGWSANTKGKSGGVGYGGSTFPGGLGSLVVTTASINGPTAGTGGSPTVVGNVGSSVGTYAGATMMAAGGGGTGGSGATRGGQGGSILSSVGLNYNTVGPTTILAGGAGGTSGNPGSPGLASIINPVAPNASALHGFICGGSGGGGGGQGAAGGQGGFPGAGGGGGGGGGAAANGGAGGNGYLIIIEYM
jgi:hypothetical protein